MVLNSFIHSPKLFQKGFRCLVSHLNISQGVGEGGIGKGGGSMAQNNLKMERVKIITELINSEGRGG